MLTYSNIIPVYISLNKAALFLHEEINREERKQRKLYFGGCNSWLHFQETINGR